MQSMQKLYQKLFSFLDSQTLFATTRVDRVWCINSIPILWREPFITISYHEHLYNYTEKALLIVKIYLSCLPDESKSIIKNSGINIPYPLDGTPTFNYSSFLHNLNYLVLSNSLYDLISYEPNSLLRIKPCKIIIQELLKFLISNSSGLRSIDLTNPLISKGSPMPLKYLGKSFMNIFSVPGANTFISNLQSFSCTGHSPPELIYSISEMAKRIRSLGLQDLQDNDGIIALINAQKELKYVRIDSYYPSDISQIYSALKSQSNSLCKVSIIGHERFLLDLFCQCPNLEEFIFIHDRPEDKDYDDLVHPLEGKIQVRDRPRYRQPSNTRTNILSAQAQLHASIPILNLTKLRKMKIHQRLFRTEHRSMLIQLIQKTQGSLQDIDFDFIVPLDPGFSKQLFMTICSECPNLQRLNIQIHNDLITQVTRLFDNCENLIEIHLSGSHDDTRDITNTIFKIGKYLPKNLQLFDLNLQFWTYSLSSVKSFLSQCYEKLNRKPLIYVIHIRFFKQELKDLLDQYEKKGVIVVKTRKVAYVDLFF
ncbi:11286_t:CDS:2 [Diversispora eburnea]|uniref:11286_t:CDS:1 n=1 Tax=Diversispora eburnea TaxID=1213867 RepID=A0A9N8Z9B0_9GLOM|nr:11286_t:CDS:2 [Diversispora eburnea]